MSRIASFLAFALLFTCTSSTPAAEVKPYEKPLAAGLNFEMSKLGKKEKINLAKEYQGKVVLLVNVASKCGLTPQYKGLQALHEKYAKQGLAIVGVPCNQFAGQEPGAAEEIATFCSTNYNVEFDLLEKSNVKSNKPDQCRLYAYLTSKETNPEFAGNIKWNFAKFLYDRQGNVVARFAPTTKPESKKVIEAIEKALAN